jgi:hypothetical protein
VELEKSKFSIWQTRLYRFKQPGRKLYAHPAKTINLGKNCIVTLPNGVVIYDVREIDCYYHKNYFNHDKNFRAFIIYFVSMDDRDLGHYETRMDFRHPGFLFHPIIIENENDKNWDRRKHLVVFHTTLKKILEQDEPIAIDNIIITQTVLFNRRFLRHIAEFI